MERPLVQILVVVANIQTRSLKTEVGKGSARTAVGRGLVDPKGQGKSNERWAAFVHPSRSEREAS